MHLKASTLEHGSILGLPQVVMPQGGYIEKILLKKCTVQNLTVQDEIKKSFLAICSQAIFPKV